MCQRKIGIWLKNTHSPKNATTVGDNYRPISVLSVFSKLFETLIKSRLIAYIPKFSVMNKNKYGFQSNISTIHTIVDFEKFCSASTEL